MDAAKKIRGIDVVQSETRTNNNSRNHEKVVSCRY